jgi:hypothetical protein
MVMRRYGPGLNPAMRLSASVNLFNGDELLLPALKSLRSSVDHISIIYQTISYWGNPAPETLTGSIVSAMEAGFADDAVEYDPGEFPADAPKQHEARKRTMGISLAARKRATHFLSADVDEFYRPHEFRAAQQRIAAGGFDVTVCRIRDYHSRPVYRCADLAKYRQLDLYIPFICKVHDGVAFDPTLEFFCAVDPSRRLPCQHPHVFSPEELVMHHMTTVRRDRVSLASKFANAASRRGWELESPHALAELVWRFDPRIHKAPVVEIVADEFGLSGIRQDCSGEMSIEFH